MAANVRLEGWADRIVAQMRETASVANMLQLRRSKLSYRRNMLVWGRWMISLWMEFLCCAWWVASSVDPNGVSSMQGRHVGLHDGRRHCGVLGCGLQRWSMVVK